MYSASVTLSIVYSREVCGTEEKVGGVGVTCSGLRQHQQKNLSFVGHQTGGGKIKKGNPNWDPSMATRSRHIIQSAQTCSLNVYARVSQGRPVDAIRSISSLDAAFLARYSDSTAHLKRERMMLGRIRFPCVSLNDGDELDTRTSR
jgi:hypothetical protein